MPRGLTASQKAAIAQRVVSFAYFVELQVTAPVLVWSGLGTVVAGGKTWNGVGDFGIIEGLASDASLRAENVSLALAGFPGDLLTPGIVAGTRSQSYRGAPLNIYLSLTNDSTGVPSGDFTLLWSGFADVLTFQAGETATAALTGEHFSSHLRRSNGARMTTESHNARLNAAFTDLFFEAQNRLMGRSKPLLKA